MQTFITVFAIDTKLKWISIIKPCFGLFVLHFTTDGGAVMLMATPLKTRAAYALNDILINSAQVTRLAAFV